MPNAYLLGPIIYLRPLEREDARALAGWFNDPEVNRTLRSYRPMNVAAEEEFLKERSPLYKADRITKPLLIGQGANDPRVKQAESDQIVKAMRDAKKEVQYVVYPDEGHGFVRPENRLHFFAVAEEFLAKHLGGRAEPIGDIKGHTGEIK